MGLNWADIDFQLGIVRVVGKGSKERIVPIGEVALQTLRDYSQEVRRNGISPVRAKSRCFSTIAAGGSRPEAWRASSRNI